MCLDKKVIFGLSLKELIKVQQVNSWGSVFLGMHMPGEVHDQVIIFTYEQLEFSHAKGIHIRKYL